MSADERSIAAGLAIPLPAMSGAEPCTGSKIPGRAVAEAGRGRQAEPAGHAGGDVGEDVAEGVLRQKDVELARREHELHAAVVDEHVLQLDVGVVGRDSLDHLAPEPRRREDVRLVHGGDVAAAGAGELEAAACDPLDLLGPVLHRVVDGSVVADAALAVVEAADELAHDEEVDALAARRTQVRVDVELAAQADEALLGPHVGAVELGSADRPHEHGVGAHGRPRASRPAAARRSRGSRRRRRGAPRSRGRAAAPSARGRRPR